jgi:hypothetical protein
MGITHNRPIEEAGMGVPLFTPRAEADVATGIWIVVFIFWGIATVMNFGSGSWVLADLPSGLAAVLVAVPISKGVAEGLRHFGKGA